jgi:hypothetical protein
MPCIDDIIARHGAQENVNGGIYISGATYGYEKKLEVAVAYHRGLEKNPTAAIATIARDCKVGQKFVGKIVNELSANSRVLCPGEIERESRGTKITGFAATVVLRLYMEEPSCSKCSYRNLLLCGDGIPLTIDARAMKNPILGLPCIANPVGPVVGDPSFVRIVILPGTLVMPVEGTDYKHTFVRVNVHTPGKIAEQLSLPFVDAGHLINGGENRGK